MTNTQAAIEAVLTDKAYLQLVQELNNVMCMARPVYYVARGPRSVTCTLDATSTVLMRSIEEQIDARRNVILKPYLCSYDKASGRISDSVS